jgi:thiol-disulfide isomerase/thioredoxin
MATSALVIASFAAVVAAANLLLTLALTRRVRLLQGGAAPVSGDLPSAGSAIGRFETQTVDGRPLTDRDAGERDVIAAFLSPTCEPCRRLLSRMRDAPPMAREVVCFVVADAGEEATAEVVAALRPVGTVAVVEPDGGPVEAFGVTAYPTVVRVRDGVVVMSGRSFEAVLGADEALAVPG